MGVTLKKITFKDGREKPVVAKDFNDMQTNVQTALNSLDTAKQNTLTAGSNITISNNTISATDTKYTAGTNITITNGVISATATSSGTTITTQAFSKSVTAKAYTGTISSMGTLSTPSGYTFIGLLPKTISASGSMIAFNVYAQGTTVYANVSNGGGDATVTVTATALFIKNS